MPGAAGTLDLAAGVAAGAALRLGFVDAMPSNAARLVAARPSCLVGLAGKAFSRFMTLHGRLKGHEARSFLRPLPRLNLA